MVLRIASWNVNSLKARAAHVERFVAEHAPDMLCLQEIKGEALATQIEGYQAAAVLQKTYNGVAIFGRVPFAVVQERLWEDDTQARYLEVECPNALRLIAIYAPNGNPVGSDKFTYKCAWLDHLVARVHTLRAQRMPFVIVGDFNIIPQPQDCHDVAAWADDALYAREAREAWRTLINLGLTDALRAIKGQGEEAYSFWGYQASAWPRNHGIRIDHALLSPPLADRLISCDIVKECRGWDTPSDHAPLVMELDL